MLVLDRVRRSFGSVPVALNLAAIVVIAVFAGKLYRVGLHTYGRPPKLTQVWAVLRS